jgi:hypothetical protein
MRRYVNCAECQELTLGKQTSLQMTLGRLSFETSCKLRFLGPRHAQTEDYASHHDVQTRSQGGSGVAVPQAHGEALC